jgi:hypothetical protein
MSNEIIDGRIVQSQPRYWCAFLLHRVAQHTYVPFWVIDERACYMGKVSGKGENAAASKTCLK